MEARSKYSLHEKLTEIYLWFGVGLVFSLPAIADEKISNPSEYLKNYQIELFTTIGLCLFPVVINLIFKTTPFLYIREKINVANTDNPKIQMGDNDTEETFELKLQSNESKTISEKIFNRSGIYLISGTTIAFIGLFFFLHTNEQIQIRRVNRITAIA